MAKCDHDCFNCPHPDCIEDKATVEEIIQTIEIEDENRRIQIEYYHIKPEGKTKAQSAYEWYWTHHDKVLADMRKKKKKKKPKAEKMRELAKKSGLGIR